MPLNYTLDHKVWNHMCNHRARSKCSQWQVTCKRKLLKVRVVSEKSLQVYYLRGEKKMLKIQ